MNNSRYIRELPGHNVQLIRAIAATGHLSYKDFASAHGLSQTHLQQLVRNDAKPVGPHRPTAEHLMVIFGKMFNQLFDDQDVYDYEEEWSETQTHAEALFATQCHELGNGYSPDERVDEDAFRHLMHVTVSKELRPQEADVLSRRFGFFTDEATLGEVGIMHGVSTERIRQIEAKALRKLRHPTRSSQFRTFLYPEWEVEARAAEQAAAVKEAKEKLAREEEEKRQALLPKRGDDKNIHFSITLEQAYTGGVYEHVFVDDSGLQQTVPIIYLAGTGDKTVIALPGYGFAGRNGGPAGNAVFTITVEESEIFIRRGWDLYCALRVTVKPGEESAEVDVPTMKGTVCVRVARTTSQGQHFRLPGRGMYNPMTHSHGDVIFRVYLKHLPWGPQHDPIYSNMQKVSPPIFNGG